MITIAAVQFEPAYRNPPENIRRIETLLDGVDADLIVLPELFSTGYFFRTADEIRDLAEPLSGGASTEWLQTFSDAKGSVVVAGFAEQDGDRIFNSAAILRPGGEKKVYRKTHLFYREKDVFAPGDTGFEVIDCHSRNGIHFRLGTMICFDWYFPEAARSLALLGADVIAHPSNLVRKDCPRSMPIRALENHVFTITSNRTGSDVNAEETLTFIGKSLICDPKGDILASAGPDESVVLMAEIDPHTARHRAINATNDLFADRRPDMYTALK
jgi:predicted amidohydrolase